jgi:hypothetical protein
VSPETPKICRNCKSWAKNLCFVAGYTLGNKRQCLHRALNMDDHPQGCRPNISDALILTTPTFGCIHFEPKDMTDGKTESKSV